MPSIMACIINIATGKILIAENVEQYKICS